MGTYETLILDMDRDSGLSTITINRPHRANTVSPKLTVDIVAAMNEIEAEASSRAVIITGAGKHFSGGADLRAMGEPGEPEAVDFRAKIENSPLPVIAAINGACMGGGCELALSCDFRIIAASATIGLPEIQFGALPGWGGTQRLARNVGPSRAKEILMTGRHIPAADAERWGYVDYMVPDAQLMDRAKALAMEIMERAKYAVSAAKFLVNVSMETDLERGLKIEQRVLGRMATAEESQAERDRAAARGGVYQRIFKKD